MVSMTINVNGDRTVAATIKVLLILVSDNPTWLFTGVRSCCLATWTHFLINDVNYSFHDKTTGIPVIGKLTINIGGYQTTGTANGKITFGKLNLGDCHWPFKCQMTMAMIHREIPARNQESTHLVDLATLSTWIAWSSRPRVNIT